MYRNVSCIFSWELITFLWLDKQQQRRVFTSRAVWRWPRTALCSDVSPSLARKSIWAPPSTRTRMASPPPGSHCTARDRGVSGRHRQGDSNRVFSFFIKWIVLELESESQIIWEAPDCLFLRGPLLQSVGKLQTMHLIFYTWSTF